MEALIKKAAHKLALAQNLDAEREAVVAYGMVAIVQMLSILLLSIIIGFIIHAVLECIIIYLAVGLLRKVTGGAHAASMGACITVSLISITIMALGAKIAANYLIINLPFVIEVSLICYGFCYLLVALRAPVDNPNKPINNPKKIKRLRIHSLIFLTVCLIISITFLLLSNITDNKIWYNLHFALTLALLWQSFTLTPLAQKITGFFHH